MLIICTCWTNYVLRRLYIVVSLKLVQQYCDHVSSCTAAIATGHHGTQHHRQNKHEESRVCFACAQHHHITSGLSMLRLVEVHCPVCGGDDVLLVFFKVRFTQTLLTLKQKYRDCVQYKSCPVTRTKVGTNSVKPKLNQISEQERKEEGRLL